MKKEHCDCCDAVIVRTVPRLSITIGEGFNVMADMTVTKRHIAGGGSVDGAQALCQKCTFDATQAYLAELNRW